jgi:serine/threonine protein kinase
LDRIGAVLVDTYRIERLIAEGGMGAVYEASHLRIPKKFAIKFLKVSLLDNSVALLRFRREAEVVATLDHPHIVSLLDYNITSDGVPYTILEYLEGEHLGDRVSRGRLPLVDIVRIVDAVCSALSAAHQKGVIHRDLKPENVILCTAGAIKVVDFGIAKLRGGQELTAFNSILGTITYMAPEQLIAGQIDARADQFAIAAMTYEMLSGEMPFGSEGSIPEIAERVLRHQPAPIPGYPPPLHEVLLRAMAKDAGQRYADVTAFCAAFKEASRPLLEQAGVPEPVAAPPPPKPVLTPTVERPTVAPKPVAAPTDTPTEPAAALEHVDEGLPDLPGEATSISMTPLPAVISGPIAVAKPIEPPTGETTAPSERLEPTTGETAMPAE